MTSGCAGVGEYIDPVRMGVSYGDVQFRPKCHSSLAASPCCGGSVRFGVTANIVQIRQQMLQVLFVGMTLGMCARGAGARRG